MDTHRICALIVGDNKSDIHYQVIRDIPNRDWNSFARSYLKLHESIIDNIETDHSANVQEQQYRMLSKWEHMNGKWASFVLLCNKTSFFNCELLYLQKTILQLPY